MTVETPSDPNMLDLTVAPDRPTVRLPAGDYKMRISEELTFEQFVQQVRIGEAMVEKAADTDTDGIQVLEELQAMIVESAMVLLVDLDAETAATITPGQYKKISAFFNELGSAVTAPPSESG